ncbi:MAG: tetratricopeptide repeat protein [Bacteroidales bacterium]|nr:tetratricopeptide repeat protein [Bacteroidales bacterium]MBD5190557.1 tetratricopeptide repeat protein [Bacteroidales bacterium]MBD5209519.1 tetratricopeptide repeat protein [Bacteroidales bacterium]MDE6083789.1 tetratricopeptide repeat protein [Muribaculaceae bacterium]
MASNNQTPEENGIDILDKNLNDMSRRIATNKKAIYVAFGGIIAIAAITLGYIYLYKAPKTEKAFDAYNKVELNANITDSVAAKEYKKVADEYSGTDAGNIAALSAAESYYNIKNYKEAAKYLEKFSTKDEVLASNAKTLLGDCYVNLKQYDKALDAYNAAVRSAKGNKAIVPRILLKEANVYDEQKKYADALNCYEAIKKDYPQFQLGNNVSIDAYIEREKARLGK